MNRTETNQLGTRRHLTPQGSRDRGSAGRIVDVRGPGPGLWPFGLLMPCFRRHDLAEQALRGLAPG